MRHGGDIKMLSEEAGRKVTDMSASLNPLGMPEGARLAAEAALGSTALHYPSPLAEDLRAALATAHNIEEDRLLCGNGSTELIYLLPRALKPKTVLIVAPSFTEYERAARAAGARIIYHKLSHKNGYAIDPGAFAKATKGAEMAFLCNPNNPTGGLLMPDEVEHIAEAAGRHGCTLVMDEAFMDYVPGASVLGLLDRPNIVVLRSMTKFYGLAGLRVGFGWFPRGILKRVLEHKEPWSVNALALASACAALKDTRFAEATHRLMAMEKRYMEAGFARLGLSYLPSSVNYYMIRARQAAALRTALLKQGIALRDCSDMGGLARGRWLRVAVLDRKRNKKFLSALAKEEALWRS